MPEVQYTTQVALPREAVWEFVKDMNNWAPYLTGYQTHEVLSETDSIWTLKGDVGVLARIVKLKAHVTEWNGPERVSFTLTGLNEQVDGDGTLEMGAPGERFVIRRSPLVELGVAEEAAPRRMRVPRSVVPHCALWLGMGLCTAHPEPRSARAIWRRCCGDRARSYPRRATRPGPSLVSSPGISRGWVTP